MSYDVEADNPVIAIFVIATPAPVLLPVTTLTIGPFVAPTLAPPEPVLAYTSAAVPAPPPVHFY